MTLTVAAFFGYLFSYGIMSILCGVYPLEVFPTSVRTLGMGFAAAMSRVGAAIGTFLLPTLLATFGLETVLFGLAAVCRIGGVTSAFLAPRQPERNSLNAESPEGTDRRIRRPSATPIPG